MLQNRNQRILDTLDRRQPDLTVLMDKVNKTQNLAAVTRNADAVGVMSVNAVYDYPQIKQHGMSSAGSQNWVRTIVHPTIPVAMQALKAQGFTLIAANLSDTTIDYRDYDYLQPTAIVLGAEKHGVSAETLAYADHEIKIPMQGMTSSLNVSVAAGLILFEAQRQRLAAGMYDRCRLDHATREQLRFEWLHKKIAQYCNKHNLPYPAMDEDGFIISDITGKAAHK